MINYSVSCSAYSIFGSDIQRRSWVRGSKPGSESERAPRYRLPWSNTTFIYLFVPFRARGKQLFTTRLKLPTLPQKRTHPLL